LGDKQGYYTYPLLSGKKEERKRAIRRDQQEERSEEVVEGL